MFSFIPSLLYFKSCIISLKNVWNQTSFGFNDQSLRNLTTQWAPEFAIIQQPFLAMFSFIPSLLYFKSCVISLRKDSGQTSFGFNDQSLRNLTTQWAPEFAIIQQPCQAMFSFIPSLLFFKSCVISLKMDSGQTSLSVITSHLGTWPHSEHLNLQLFNNHAKRCFHSYLHCCTSNHV